MRAAEISISRRGLQLQRFGQVGLPLGAVSGGEVVDPTVVGSALRRLWAEAGFTSKKVNVVVSGQRMIVRQAQVPQMTETDFRSALRFQAAELLPIPIDDAILDFSVLGHGVGDATPGEMTILLAGTHREVIQGQMAALREAGLTASGVCPAPLSIMQAARTASIGGDGCYAVVDVGADLTLMVVCEADVVRFSRVTRAGGRAVTALLAQRSGSPPEVAETAKRVPAPGPGGGLDLAVREFEPLVSEIEGSLNFFASQLSTGALDAVYLTGGSSLNALLLEELRDRLSVEVAVLDVLKALDTTPLLELDVPVVSASPFATLALGAAIAGSSSGRRIDLLPPEVAAAAARRRSTLLMAGGAAVLAVGLAAVSVTQEAKVVSTHSSTAALTAQNRAYSRDIGSLSAVSELARATNLRKNEAAAAASGELDWTALEAAITHALPPGMALTSLSMTSGVATTGAATTSTTSTSSSTAIAAAAPSVPAGGVGSVTMDVTSSGGEDAVAKWLQAMTRVVGLEGPWVASASASGGTATFAGTATITSSAPIVQRSTNSGKGQS